MQGDSNEFDKAVEFTLDTPYSAWPILMKLVRHTNHMLRYVISDNATTSHRGIAVNWKSLPHAVPYTTETVDILRLLVNMFANARSEHIEILLQCLYPKEHTADGAMINLVSVLTHLLSRGTCGSRIRFFFSLIQFTHVETHSSHSATIYHTRMLLRSRTQVRTSFQRVRKYFFP